MARCWPSIFESTDGAIGTPCTAAAPGAPLLAEGQPTEAAVLVPHAVYNLGSTMLMYNDAAVEAAPVAEDAPAAETEEAIVEEPAKPEKKTKKKKKKIGRKGLHSVAEFTEEDSPLHIVLRRLYVIAILALAFLAGLTMRYWMITGEYLIDELLK
ncbi:MAG: hypothetical protein IIV41_07760 [Akkermansia sp.]|nr:hypothetical protein [Akkermansia sp.]